MNPSFYLIVLLSCGLTLVQPVPPDEDQTELTKQQILDRNALWKGSVDEVLDTFFQLIERTQALEKLVEKLTTRVAFSVTDPTPIVAGDVDVALKYGTVLTNIGDDYDTATGIFTVDTPGLYYFTFFFHTTNKKFGTAGLELHVNDVQKVKSIEQIAGADYIDSAGNAVILDLAKGDLVKVVLKEDMCVKDEASLNTFTGFLLQPSFTTDPPGSFTTDPPAPEIRLVSGEGPCAGTVEVLHEGVWGTVCWNGWDENDAQVVCRELRCGQGIGALGEYGLSYGGGTGPVHYQVSRCEGSESRLSECNHNPIGDHHCTHSSDAGVFCEKRVQDPYVAG